MRVNRIRKMKDKNIVTSHSTTCQLCGELVRWSDNDEDYGDLYSKLKYHLNNGACARNEKIKEILGIENEPNSMKWFK